MTITRAHQTCTTCVMDTSAPEITFDAHGVCHWCRNFKTHTVPWLMPVQAGTRTEAFEAEIAAIKKRGQGKAYDCILGLSGGVDSSYLALIAKQAGLRVLAVHCDSGWNSELAVNNIEHIVKILGFDLDTVILDWEEIRDLQRAFFEAGVPNCDIPQDHAFIAALYRQADKHGITTILSGSNMATEAILPHSWGYDASDLRHLRAIHKKFGRVPLKTFPLIPFWKRYFYYPFVKGIRRHHLLNAVPYNRAEAKAILAKELGWRDYGGKHYESIFTKFFQSYYLVHKFGFDKRRAHLSSLIVSGQMSRDDALKILEQPAFDALTIKDDQDYIAKKLGYTPAQFEGIINAPAVSHSAYPTNRFLFDLKDRIVSRMRSYLHAH